jgi:hypothetical protein
MFEYRGGDRIKTALLPDVHPLPARLRREETMMVNTTNWDKFSKRIVLGLIVSALVAACFLLLGIYFVGAEEVGPHPNQTGIGCESPTSMQVCLDRWATPVAPLPQAQ